ncbi:MAG TPA: hypothetical protein VF331_05450 [Polyangiales bacterium]
MTDTLFLLAERDSRWIDWARAWRDPQHILVLLVPHGEESREEFCDRVQARLKRLPADGDRLRRVVLTSGACWDGPALLGRAQMIRSILARIADHGGPTSVLLDCGPKDGPASIGMQAIAEALTECVLDRDTQLHLVAGPSASALRAA